MKIIFKSALLCVLFSSSALLAQEDTLTYPTEKDLGTFLSLLGRINSQSLLEGAGSHGTIGFALGGGVSLINMPETSAFHESELYLENQDVDKTALVIPKAYLLKGAFSPVDLGITFGSIEGARITQAVGTAQWTIYEDFAMPALALRFNYARLFGLASGEFTTVSSELVLSCGLFKYFNTYGGGTVSRHMASLDLEPFREDGRFQYFLSENEDRSELKKDWLETSYFVGLQLHLFSPFYFAAAEMQVSEDNLKSYSAKISIGM